MTLNRKQQKLEINKKLFGEGLMGDDAPFTGSIIKDRFILPPFSVLNSREALWIQRRRAWSEIGIESELGRKDSLAFNKIAYREVGRSQTSIFDPVLCELMYSWYCPPGGQVLDPFAGGSCRGIVASVLGLRYWGCDLSEAQIKANRGQLKAGNTGPHKPEWVCGNSVDMMDEAPYGDLLFSCPPYGNLEQYSKDPDDLCNLEWRAFKGNYRTIIRRACDALLDNRFAVFVVGNYRDKDTRQLRDLSGLTVECFENAGLKFYSDAILLNSVGSAAVRTNTIFIRGKRKLVRIHQSVLIFVKGEPPDMDWQSCQTKAQDEINQ